MSRRKFRAPRGMRDIEPDEMAKRIWLYDRIADVMRRYAFMFMEPSPIEKLETLEAKSGPQIRDEIYWFKDKAGRRLGLRFDLTVGISRFVASQYKYPEPLKLCSIGGQWRYDEPQFGRYRYFTQWDAEIYGSSDPLADAEVISLGCDILTTVGLNNFNVRVSSRRLIQGFLKGLGIKAQAKIEAVLRIIDKVRKVPRQRIINELKQNRLNERAIRSIMQFIELSGNPYEALGEIKRFAIGEEAKRGYEELEGLVEALEAFGKLDKIVLDLSIVRGIGYYDGLVFEAYDIALMDLGTLFAGGRYDKLCSIYGRDIPATGVAGGIERLMIALERNNVMPTLEAGPKLLVAAVTDALRKDAIRIAQRLREAGIWTEVDVKRRNLSKQLEYADSRKIPYVAILGPRELQANKLRLRNMKTGEELEQTMDEILQKLMHEK